MQDDTQLNDPQSQNSHKISHLSSQEAQDKFSGKMKEIELKEKEHEIQLKALSLGLPYVYLVGVPIPPGPLLEISEEDAKNYQAICFAESVEEKRIGITDYENEEVATFLKKYSENRHVKVIPFLCSQQSFEFAFDLYSKLPKIKETLHGGIQITEDDLARYKDIIADIRSFQKVLDNELSMTEFEKLLAIIGL